MKNKNILITGGAGFIGSNLAQKLIDQNYNVTILDNLSPQIHGENPEQTSPLYQSIINKVEFLRGDVTNRKEWETALKNKDVVVHFAAETGTGQSMYDIEKYNSRNILGTAILWDILANQTHNIKKVVIASSRAIYGEGKYKCDADGVVYPLSRKNDDMKLGDFQVKCPICGKNANQQATSEDSKIHPTSIYGFTKQAQEEMSMIAGKSLNIPVVSLRYQNVYGPGQSLSNPYTGILSIFSTRIKNWNDILIFEDGEESRDFVYIDDVVKATLLGIETDKANFHCLNVGSGEQTSVIEIAKLLKEKFNSSVNIKISGNYRIGDIRSNYSDLTMIKKILGYSPNVSFEEGIAKFVAWVNEQDIKEDGFLDSIEEMKNKGLYK